MYTKFARNKGPRCAVCGASYTPRTLRDGTMSRTCGKTACVARLSRRQTPTHADFRKLNTNARAI